MAETTSIKLKQGLKERIDRLAKEEDRSAHWLMNRAIEEYVDRKEKQRQFDKDAEESWEEYQRTGLHLTGEEVLDWLERRIRGEDVPLPEPHT
jgi:predicted transcriptional regulator